jgi:hypothetical protein
MIPFKIVLIPFPPRTEDGDRNAGDSLSAYNNLPFSMSYHGNYNHSMHKSCLRHKYQMQINGW